MNKLKANTDPCSLIKEELDKAHFDGREAGRLLLGAGLNPYPDSRPYLQKEWEAGRLEGTAKKLTRGR